MIDRILPGGTEVVPPDHRKAPRHQARNPRATLSWAQGEDFAFAPARIVNISRTGLLLVADAIPPAGLSVRVRFEDALTTRLDARVVLVNRTARGPHWIRVAFTSPCPGWVLDSVIAGRDGGGPAATKDEDGALRLLGLTWPCTRADVQAAFRLRSKAMHPDVGGTVEQFTALRRAFETLLLACQAGSPPSDGSK